LGEKGAEDKKVASMFAISESGAGLEMSWDVSRSVAALTPFWAIAG